MAIYTYQDIVSGEFNPRKWEDFARFWNVNYIDAAQTPRMTFQWLPREAAYVSAEQAATLKVYAPVPADKPTPEKAFLVWGSKLNADGELNVINRYFKNNAAGWVWGPSEAILTNTKTLEYGDFAGLEPENSELRIHYSLVAAIAKLDVPSELKYHIKVESLWERMLIEALATPYFAARNTPTRYGHSPCWVNGVEYKQ